MQICSLSGYSVNLIWKESLNSDGQQFHQYQQSKQLPLISNHWTEIRRWHTVMEIQVHAWDWHKNTKYFFTDENCDKYFALMAGVLHNDPW